MVPQAPERGPTAVVRPLTDEVRRAWQVGGAPVRAAAVVGLVLMLVGAVHAVAFAVAGGPWQGPVAWRKPFAFGLSFGLTTVTVAWVVTRLDLRRWIAWVLLGAFSLAATTEVAWVTVQRARGVASHFNDDTPADQLAFTVAGGMSVSVIALVLAALFVLSWRRTAPPTLASAIRSGLAILLVSQVVGSQMIARGIASLGDGGPATHAVPPAGDLKVSHAVAMHAIQVLPAVALWVMTARRTTAGGRRLVRGVAVVYALVVGATLLLAANGRSLTELFPWS